MILFISLYLMSCHKLITNYRLRSRQKQMFNQLWFNSCRTNQVRNYNAQSRNYVSVRDFSMVALLQKFTFPLLLWFCPLSLDHRMSNARSNVLANNATLLFFDINRFSKNTIINRNKIVNNGICMP